MSLSTYVAPLETYTSTLADVVIALNYCVTDIYAMVHSRRELRMIMISHAALLPSAEVSYDIGTP